MPLSAFATKNAGLAACHTETQTSELIRQVLVQKERGLFKYLKDPPNHLSFLLKPVVLIGMGGAFFFYLIILLALGAGVLSIYLSSFCLAQCKDLLLYHLEQLGRLLGAPID